MLSLLCCSLVILLLTDYGSAWSITPRAIKSSSSSSSRSRMLTHTYKWWKRNVKIELRDNERYSKFILYGSGENEIDTTNEQEVLQLKKEEEDLQNELHYIQALVQRNKAQLGSFVDEKHQWESQSEEDRYFLTRKPMVTKRLKEVRLKLTSFVLKEL